MSLKEATKFKFGKMNSINVQSTKFSIDPYIRRHSRMNLEIWVLQHKTFKRTKLLKQPNKWMKEVSQLNVCILNVQVTLNYFDSAVNRWRHRTLNQLYLPIYFLFTAQIYGGPTLLSI